jgi:urea transport system substrate-binding protein
VRRFKERYGPQRVTDDPVESAYYGVHLWAAAAEEAGDDPKAIREALRGRRFNAPGGEVRIDPDNLHTWQYFRVGRVRADGQFEVVWSNDTAIRPEPFPASRSRAEWERFLADAQAKGGGR